MKEEKETQAKKFQKGRRHIVNISQKQQKRALWSHEVMNQNNRIPYENEQQKDWDQIS